MRRDDCGPIAPRTPVAFYEFYKLYKQVQFARLSTRLQRRGEVKWRRVQAIVPTAVNRKRGGHTDRQCRSVAAGWPGSADETPPAGHNR